MIRQDKESSSYWRTVVAIMITVLTRASAFAGIHVGLASYSPEGTALLRYLTASLALAVFAAGKRSRLLSPRDLLGMAINGFLSFGFYNVALNAGEMRILAGTARLIIASAPIYVALLTSLLFKERRDLRALTGIATSFIGVGMISVRRAESLGLSTSVLIALAGGALVIVGVILANAQQR